VLEGKPYEGSKVDIFSLGVIVFVMVTGALPYFKDASVHDPIYKHLCRGQPDWFWEQWR
jgi:serine/threonine protein kinase